jgi:hypothetical protein
MLSRILPRLADNTYRGHWLGAVLFVGIVALKLVQAVSAIVDTRGVAVFDGLALDRLGPEGANAVLSMLAVVGFILLMILLLCVVVAIRYRALIPLMYLILLIEHGGRRLLFLLNPIVKTAAYDALPTALYVNIAFFAVLLLGFALSLRRPAASNRTAAEEVH